MGYAEDEENLKEQILALSSDQRHFLRPPPGGVSYQFDYETSYPIALATLEADPMLRVRDLLRLGQGEWPGGVFYQFD